MRQFVRQIDRNLDEGRGLWFFGDVGTGKTSLAMLVSKAALDAGHTVAIYSVPRLLADIKETYDDDPARSYSELFRRLCDVDLLHLDDLGAEKRTEWVLEQLYSIVNERWQNERSIVVTTNLEHDELREQIGDAHGLAADRDVGTAGSADGQRPPPTLGFLGLRTLELRCRDWQ